MQWPLIASLIIRSFDKNVCVCWFGQYSDCLILQDMTGREKPMIIQLNVLAIVSLCVYACACVCVWNGNQMDLCTCVWIIISWLDACSLTVQPMMSWLTRILIIHQNKVPFHTHTLKHNSSRQTVASCGAMVLCGHWDVHCAHHLLSEFIKSLQANMMHLCEHHTQRNAYTRTHKPTKPTNQTNYKLLEVY